MWRRTWQRRQRANQLNIIASIAASSIQSELAWAASR